MTYQITLDKKNRAQKYDFLNQFQIIENTQTTTS
jgi:hypothetical protein